MSRAWRLAFSVCPVLLVCAWFDWYLRVPPDCDVSVDGPCNLTMSLRLLSSVAGACIFFTLWVALIRQYQKRRFKHEPKELP